MDKSKVFKRLFFIFTLLILCMACLCSCHLLKNKGSTDTYTVKFNQGKNFTIIGDSEIQVEEGEDAIFEVEIEAGYVLKSSKVAEYEDGKVIVKNVQKDTTFTLRAILGEFDVTLEDGEHYTVVGANTKTVAAFESAVFTVNFDSGYAMAENEYFTRTSETTVVVKNVTADISEQIPTMQGSYVKILTPATALGSISGGETGDYPKGAKITLTINTVGNAKFAGWTVGNTLKNGAEVISENKTHTFTVTDGELKIYPNVFSETEHIVIYDLCGGYVADTSEESYSATFSNRLLPHLIPDDGTFKKDGYTLLEYNTKADGTGIAVNPGGLLTEVDKTGITTVYAIWAQWSPTEDFTYSGLNEITISGYTGNDSMVVIPEQINGKPVTRIAGGTFNNKSFTTLVIPKSVTKIDSASVKNCTRFDTLYICDSFTSVPDDAFPNQIKNIRINASEMPAYFNNSENLSYRLERIITRDKDIPLIILVAGSSTLYGYDSELLYKGLKTAGLEHTIINSGTNAGGTGMLYMEAYSHFMQSGDKIINAAEYGSYQMGKYEITTRTLRATETCYNLYRYIDFTKYTNFFSSMSDFNSQGTDVTRYNMNRITSYDANPSSLNDYGDLNGDGTVRRATADGWELRGAQGLTAALAANYNELNALLEAKGITLYYTLAPLTNGAGAQEYINTAISLLDCEVLMKEFDTRLIVENSAKDWCNNSFYHLTWSKAQERAQIVLEDLIEVLK